MRRNLLDVTPTVTKPPVHWGAVTKSFTYENNTGVPIYVTESTGAYTIVEPKRNVISPNAFVIYITYKTPPGTVNLIGVSDIMPSAVYRTLCTELDRTGESTLMYVIDDPIPILRGEAVVLTKLGLTFSKSQLEIDRSTPKNGHAAGQLTLGVVVVQAYGDDRPIRYARYYNAIVEVTPIKAKFHREGMYLIVNGDIDNRGVMIHFEYDDPISPLRCFETEEEARNFDWKHDAIPCLNELKQKLAQQIADGELALTDRKAEMELEHKRRMNDITVEREESIAGFKNLENKMKARAEERKDLYDERGTVRKDSYDERGTVRKDTYDERSSERKERYDDRSQSRKDASETLKVIPALITAGVAIIAMLM